MLYTRIDSIMIERMLPDGKEQAGIYAQVFRLLDAVNMFAFLIAGILLPIFARLIIEKSSIKPILQTSGKFLTGVAIIASIGLALNAEFTISSIYTHGIQASSTAFFWLILSFIPLSITHVFGTLLTANHSLKLLNQIALLGIVLNISLNYFMIPILGAEGAAIATLITQSGTAIAQLIIVMNVFQLSIHWGIIVRILGLTVLYTTTTKMLETELGNIWSFLITFLIGLFFLFALKLLNLKDVFSLLKTKAVPEKANKLET